MSPILITGAILGQMKLIKPQVANAAKFFGLSKREQALLNEVPKRSTSILPTGPLNYCFYELIMINGPALKALIEQEFGDGSMSAIDLDLELARQSDPKGDHCGCRRAANSSQILRRDRQCAGTGPEGRVICAKRTVRPAEKGEMSGPPTSYAMQQVSSFLPCRR